MTAHNEDVLFIHVPKCAGWTVKRWMQEALPDVVLPVDVPGKLPMGHTALRDMEQWTGRKPESYRKIIAVVRNPYERELSEWLYRRDRFARGKRHWFDCLAAAHTTLTSFVADPLCEYHLLDVEAPGGGRHIRPPSDTTYESFGGMWMYWLSIDGEIPPNVEILRQETLTEQLPIALAEFVVGKPPDVPQRNATNHRKATGYHTALSMHITEYRCKWAFDNYYERLSEKE